MSNGTGGLEDLQLEVRDLVVAYDGIQALRQRIEQGVPQYRMHPTGL